MTRANLHAAKPPASPAPSKRNGRRAPRQAFSALVKPPQPPRRHLQLITNSNFSAVGFCNDHQQTVNRNRHLQLDRSSCVNTTRSTRKGDLTTTASSLQTNPIIYKANVAKKCDVPPQPAIMAGTGAQDRTRSAACSGSASNPAPPHSSCCQADPLGCRRCPRTRSPMTSRSSRSAASAGSW